MQANEAVFNILDISGKSEMNKIQYIIEDNLVGKNYSMGLSPLNTKEIIQ